MEMEKEKQLILSLGHKESFSDDLKFVQDFEKWIIFQIDKRRASVQRQKHAIATARYEGVDFLFNCLVAGV